MVFNLSFIPSPLSPSSSCSPSPLPGKHTLPHQSHDWIYQSAHLSLSLIGPLSIYNFKLPDQIYRSFCDMDFIPFLNIQSWTISEETGNAEKQNSSTTKCLPNGAVPKTLTALLSSHRSLLKTLPFTFLLQGNFQNRLILPRKPDEI